MASHSYPTNLSAINAQLAECVDELRVLGANVKSNPTGRLTHEENKGLSDNERIYITLQKRRYSSVRNSDDNLKEIEAMIIDLVGLMRVKGTSEKRFSDLEMMAKRP